MEVKSSYRINAMSLAEGGRPMNTKITRRFILSAGAAALFLPSGAVQAELPSDLIEKAKAEGEVVWYTDLIVDQLVRPMVEAFQKVYGIRVSYVRGDSQDIVLRVTNEYRAGNVVADICTMTSEIHVLRNAGAIEPFSVPNAEALPEQYRDADNYWIATNRYVLTPAVNTDLVPEDGRPGSYEDLLDPKWKGRIAWKPNDLSGAPGFIGNVLVNMGEEQGMEYLRRLAGQEIRIVAVSARALLDQVIAGTYPVALQIFNHHAAISEKRGAPVAWLPFSPSAVTISTGSKLTGGKHPNAAMLLLDFLVSREGQQVFQAANYLPVRPDIAPLEAGLTPENAGFAGTVLSPEIVADNYSKWNEIFNQLFR
ncbi:ABC transporter substrate-binding protein [Pseudochelatococcus sp. B33]